MVILITDNAGFRVKKITGERKQHCKMIKGELSPGGHKNLKCVYIKQQNCKIHEQKLIKLEGETYKSTILLEDFMTPLSTPPFSNNYTENKKSYRRNQHYNQL